MSDHIDLDTSHHIKGLRPALQTMSGLGFSESDCLKNTGISLEQLNDTEQGISLEQEFRFYRQLLALSKKPLIGLELGQAYRLESYGVFGYAILSAQNLAEALAIASQFSALSFSHFDIQLKIINDTAFLQMQQNKRIDQDLLALYEDRDCSAMLAGAVSALGRAFPLKHIKLMHDDGQQKQAYERFYRCPISFNNPQMEIAFDAATLKQNMPLRDRQMAEYCVKQCDRLLSGLTKELSLYEQIKQSLLASLPQALPSIKQLALNLDTSERSLRRGLSAEGHSYQSIVSEVRFHLAKDYLASDLNLEQIAHLLSYSEAANFSHAFKRWSGMSPLQYRRALIKKSK